MRRVRPESGKELSRILPLQPGDERVQDAPDEGPFAGGALLGTEHPEGAGGIGHEAHRSGGHAELTREDIQQGSLHIYSDDASILHFIDIQLPPADEGWRHMRIKGVMSNRGAQPHVETLIRAGVVERTYQGEIGDGGVR